MLVGAGSTSFGPSMMTDLFLSDILAGSTIILHDIDKEKLNMVYEIICKENEKRDNKFQIKQTIDRNQAFQNADFIVSSIEVGNRTKLWWQDYKIPRKHGSTQILGECGGPGGSFHAWRIIPPILEIIDDVKKICPEAFFINFSNPMARVCLAIKRAAPNLNFVGLCHQIGFMDDNLPKILNKELRKSPNSIKGVKEFRKKFDDELKQLKMTVGGLNHFAFLFGLEDKKSGKDLMPIFNERALDYFKANEDRFEFSQLTFEVYKRFKYFPYVGDNHLGEYLQFGEEFTETQDMKDWIERTDQYNKGIYGRVKRYYKRLQKGRYSRKGMLPDEPSGERAVAIMEAIAQDKQSYESAVNIPNEGIIENLPRDLVIECSATVDKEGVHGVKLGTIPKDIAALLRIEAAVQDVCVEAVLNKSKRLAINCLAIDPNVQKFEQAEAMFEEMMTTQAEYLSYFK